MIFLIITYFMFNLLVCLNCLVQVKQKPTAHMSPTEWLLVLFFGLPLVIVFMVIEIFKRR